MIEAIAVVAGVATVWVPYVLSIRANRRRLEQELGRLAAHNDDLMNLLKARSAPAEYAAYIEPPAESTEEWLFTDDGLHGVLVDKDDT